MKAEKLLLAFLLFVPALSAQTKIDLDTQTKGSRLPFFSTDSGSANAYSITPVGTVLVLQTGSCFIFKVANANTTASTLTVSGFSSHAIKKGGTTALTGGELPTGWMANVCYDGTNYQLMNPAVTATPPGGSTGDLQYNNGGAFGGFADGTSHQVLHGGRSFSAVDLANDVTGTLPNANITNPSLTVNGSTCTLGSSCSVGSTGGGAPADNNPHDVPVGVSPSIPYYGMNLWVSADCITVSDASTCTNPSNGTSITDWSDRSGNSNNFGNCFNTTFNTSQINGQPAVTFGGGGCESRGVPPTMTTSVFVVYKNTGGNKAGLFSGTDNSVNFYYFSGASGGTYQQGVDNQTGSNVAHATAALNSSWHQANVTCHWGYYPNFRLDRAADATVTLGTPCIVASGDTFYSVGMRGAGSEVLTGAIAELIVYRRILSSAEITTVETYLNTKYGL